MKYSYMQGSIDKECFGKFIDFWNEYNAQPCTIVINSGGGDTYVAETITHMINQMADVTIIIHAIYSAAFEICLRTKCKKILSKTAKGMWHYSRADISVNSENKPHYREDDCVVKNLPIEKKMCDNIAKQIMTKLELEKFKNNDDVYFDFKRMKQIFPDAKILL